MQQPTNTNEKTCKQRLQRISGKSLEPISKHPPRLSVFHIWFSDYTKFQKTCLPIGFFLYVYFSFLLWNYNCQDINLDTWMRKYRQMIMHMQTHEYAKYLQINFQKALFWTQQTYKHVNQVIIFYIGSSKRSSSKRCVKRIPLFTHSGWI